MLGVCKIARRWRIRDAATQLLRHVCESVGAARAGFRVRVCSVSGYEAWGVWVRRQLLRSAT